MMNKTLLLAFMLVSCTTGRGIFDSKKDYLVIENNRYIQSHLVRDIHSIGTPSGNKATIYNQYNDTIYIFSTILTNEEMLYSGKNISNEGSVLKIDSYYDSFMADAIHSGIEKFTFIELPPNDSLVININRERIAKSGAKVSGKLDYYYFFKKGMDFDGLVNITTNKINEANVKFPFQ